MNKDLKLIEDFQREMTILGQVLSLLGWDQLTYMPKKAAESRSEQTSHLSQLIHKKATDDELYNALQRLKKSKSLSKKEKLMVKKLLRGIEKSRKLPEGFVKEMSKVTTLSYMAWEKAREKNDFKIFQPHLEKVIELKRKECNYIKEPGHPYNSLLDSYEEGMTAEELKPIFKKLKEELKELISKIKNTETYKKQTQLSLEIPVEQQKELCYDVIKRIGLTEDRSRLDLSIHPFTQTAGINDIRLTTNFRKNPLFSFESTIHESGHALYELNIPEKDAYNILGAAVSLGIHESQSRFWENMIGKSRPFWKFYFPKFKEISKLDINEEQLYNGINFVKPSLIRIESDEVTYCMHVILRFEIELRLIEGTIKVKDLPKIWNKKMEELLGVVPKNDVEGVLQDMHWSQGAVGYFPTYALGSIYASQLFEQLTKEKKGIEKQIEKGDFSEISKWLKLKVHQHGNTLLPEELIKKACNKGLDVDTYISYLNEKYSRIYGFKK